MAIYTDDEIATLFGKCSFNEFTQIEQAQITVAKSQTIAAIALIVRIPDFGEQVERTVYLPTNTGSQPSNYDTIADYKGNENIPALLLQHTPVIVTDLRVWEDTEAKAGQGDDDFADDTELTIGEDFWLDGRRQTSGGVLISDTGILYRNARWSPTPGTIKVTYTGGPSAETMANYWGNLQRAYALILKDIYYALRRESSAEFASGVIKTGESIGKYSTSGKHVSDIAGGWGYSAVGSNVPTDAYQLLSPFIDVSYR
ncbi:hypothetical protein [Kordiimonas sp.]|uniref:hypothetical protein n=1 Tax=Kordiimonas sp. TaxID=1970157 RepID=UPI003A8DF8C5